MKLDDIRDLLAFDDWANSRLFDCVLSLDDEAFTRHLGGSHPTLRDAMAHLIGADWIWVQRWLGTSPPAPPEWYGSSDRALLMTELARLQSQRDAFVAGLSEHDLGRRIEFTLLSGNHNARQLGDLLIHFVNHSTYHRGQIAAMLRQLGVPPPSTDFYIYCDAGRR